MVEWGSYGEKMSERYNHEIGRQRGGTSFQAGTVKVCCGSGSGSGGVSGSGSGSDSVSTWVRVWVGL